jgi:drug/metabolite transporter (DMT)-like permease
MKPAARDPRPGVAAVILPFAILLIVGSGWGLGVALVKYGTSNGIRPFGYLFWMALGAGAVAFLVCLARRRLPKVTPLHLRYYLLIGGLRLAGANVIFYTAIQHIPVGVMSVVLGTSPIFTYALSLSLRMERFYPVRLIGIACGLGAMVMFVAPRESLPDPSMAGWTAFAILAPVLYSVANITIDRLRPSEGDSVTFAVGMLWAAALIILPVALITGDFHPIWRQVTGAEIALFVHMVINGLAFLGLFELIRIAGPTYASQLTYIVTLTGVMFGIVMFGEVHSVWVWGATALALAGVALVNLRPAARATESA